MRPCREAACRQTENDMLPLDTHRARRPPAGCSCTACGLHAASQPPMAHGSRLAADLRGCAVLEIGVVACLVLPRSDR
eukprot:149363-Prymnesium_polylepis.2